METIAPYANESEVLIIGDLTVENRVETISIYGSIDLTRDQRGLKLARTLKALFDSIVEVLATEDLPESIPPPEGIGEVENPFS